MAASWVDPTQSRLEDVFSGVPELVIVKDQAGQTYMPAYGINAIGAWNPLQAYLIYVDAAATFQMQGDSVVPEQSPINLRAGWNFIPYLRTSSMAVDQALASIAAALVLVKDQNGNIYDPAFGIDDIGGMQPGQGYSVYVDQDAVLTFPANSTASSTGSLSVSSERK